jgi:hypothetical protein
VIFFIATKHDEYRQREFASGDIVIDPWRYIPDQSGVTVRRLGENKPELISILVPSRGRARQFTDMVRSVGTTATHSRRVEIVSYHDSDDPELDLYPNFALYPFYDHEPIIGPQIVLSQMWNECYQRSHGEIFMHCGDDVIFRTPGWDQIVRNTFREYPDKIVLVHGDDVSPNTDALATHGFLHRRWVEQVGYFVPPLFSSDWNDVWLTEVADMIGRRVKVPIVTEHMHYLFGKAEYDITYRQREERGVRDDVNRLYKRTEKDRKRDAAKLQAAMR